MSIAAIGVLPAFIALLMSATRKSLPKMPQTWLVATLILGLFVGLLTFLPTVSQNGALTLSIPWVAQIGLTLSIYLDGLALLFALMIVGIGLLVVIYSGYYFEDTQTLGRFTIRLLAFMSAMLLVVLSGNLLTLFIGWELTSILSFLLIGFDQDKEEARKGALQALIVTGAGGLALLVGLVLLGTAAGSMEISSILSNTSLHESPWYSAFTVLILLGCFTKSAQWPFHFWLPGAMSAPTPASAYLHSATMVKAGIYLLIRLYPALSGTALWHDGLLVIGLLTMLMGAVFAIRQRDLKAALAYATISQLGALVALISLPNHKGIQAALVGILAHGLYKAALFLVVGAVDHSAGTRDLEKLGGLARSMPSLAIVTVIACLSMAGVPPLMGFVAKENLLDALLGNPLTLGAVVGSAVLTVAMAFTIIWDVFFKKPPTDLHVHASPFGMVLAPAVLAFASILGGLGLQAFVVPLVTPALGGHEAHLVLFSGLNTPLILSFAAFPGGLVLLTSRKRWRVQSTSSRIPNGTQLYAALVRGVEKTGDVLLRSQGGKLRYYLMAILVSVTLLQASAGLSHLTGFAIDWGFSGSVDILKTLLLLTALGMMLASIVFRSHLLAALTLGVSGYAVGGLFLIEPAPDVALVQFMVETVGTVLLIVMLSRINAERRQEAMADLWKQSRAGLIRDAVLAVVVGVGIGLFALAALNSRPRPEGIVTWHLENAEPLLQTANVVGAIVTDFRGMDTIIEITVFSISALGVLTLLVRPKSAARWPRPLAELLRRLRLLRVENISGETETHSDDHYGDDVFVSSFSTPFTRTISRVILPFAFLVGIAQMLYGDIRPGDGFTAGVITGLAVALWYVVFGYHEAREQLSWLRSRLLIGLGLTIVVGNAAFPLLIGQPFLAHLPIDIALPANLHLSSTVIYNIGIFFAVLGSIAMVMDAIAYPKEVESV